MKFYRPLRPFKAISFDLDDTLYDNHPIIEKAENDFLIWKTVEQVTDPGSFCDN